MPLCPSEAYRYFMRLAQKRHTRAALARRAAQVEYDPVIRRNLNALAKSYDEEASQLEAKALKIKREAT